MPLPPSIAERVETFRRNLASYLAPDYKETELRREFLDPLFAALGWDVFNRAGHAEAYKDVVHEDTLKISGETTAPDYSFRIGGTRKFFVEAKKPSVRIKDDAEPAKQLRRYSWSAKLPLGIVTDFHEFALYDTRIRPREGDKASTARIFYCTFEDYPEKWDEIAAIFSKAAVLNGSFDQYAVTNRGKRGTAEFDDDFLADMEAWRKRLAENLALRNPVLTQRDLNFAVQRILDRIIFLRIAEDRGIEKLGQLQALTAGPKIYPRFCDICRHADLRYNSGLFHFDTEKGREESPDRLTLGLTLDDAVLKEIISFLYYPKSPYAFAVIPADTLGHVYEQFLGKVIHLTEGHRARIEEKPEVRKAGGVYYTPTYIVNYIVRQTVGPLVEGKTPKQVETLRVLDPACGSGSFLLGAYEYLLDWHLRYYLDHDPASWARKKNPPIYETNPNRDRDASGALRRPVAGVADPGSGSTSPATTTANWQLTTAERKRILVNNLHGVDIDAQAVEVTKLSLLLKVLEGEARELQGKQLDFHRVLPDLGHNIKCGNSLIGSDFYQQPDLPAFDEEARYKLNAFDWTHEFKPIMAAGGFDAVIGNPPYRMIQPHNTEPAELSYVRSRYVSAEFKIELFHLFLQRGVTLIGHQGRLGFIVPTTLLNNVYAEKLRRWVLDECAISSISVSPQRVFKDADVHTNVVILERSDSKSARANAVIRTTTSLTEPFVERPGPFSETRQSRFAQLPGATWNILLNESNAPLIGQLQASAKLESVAKINRGLITGDREKFFAAERKTSKHVPILAGSDVARFHARRPGEFVLFERPDSAGGCWDEDVHFAPHKILVRQIGTRPMAAFIGEPIAVTGNLFTIRGSSEEHEKLLLGILNSRVTEFFWKVMFTDFKSSFPQVTIFSLSQVPIPAIDLKSKADRARHDTLVALVERMLKLHEEFAAAKSPDAQTHLQREIRATDEAIDRLVYQLYGLTDDEIQLVEQATGPAAAKAVATDTDEPPSSAPPAADYNAQAEVDAAHHYFLAKEDPPKED